MIYNLAQFIRNNIAGVVVYANTRSIEAGQTQVPDRCLLLTETGGPEQPWTGFQVLGAQVVARDVDAPKARKLAWDVHVLLNGRFGLILPAITVDGVTYPQIQTGQVSSVQTPQSLGEDGEGRTEYSTNYQVFKER